MKPISLEYRVSSASRMLMIHALNKFDAIGNLTNLKFIRADIFINRKGLYIITDFDDSIPLSTLHRPYVIH